MNTSEPGLVALLRAREIGGDRCLAHGGRRGPKRPLPDLLPASSFSSANTIAADWCTAPARALPHGDCGCGSNTTGNGGSRDHSAASLQQCPHPAGAAASAGSQLQRWAESDFLRHCSASYCSLTPLPRSTIDLDFSPDGRLLASSHGDHTVKVTCVATGRCLRVLEGHRRTPWVVRFHPRDSSLLASGSLDHQVRLWNVDTGECINSHNFMRPIASVAFNARVDELAVAAGHKLYMWDYKQPRAVPKPAGSSSASGSGGQMPRIVLKTRRSLRAVHFHPHGRPLMLTAEVVADAPSQPSAAAPLAQPSVAAAEVAPDMPPIRLPPDAFYRPAAHASMEAEAAAGLHQHAAAAQHGSPAAGNRTHPLNQILLSERAASPHPMRNPRSTRQEPQQQGAGSLRQRMGQQPPQQPGHQPQGGGAPAGRDINDWQPAFGSNPLQTRDAQQWYQQQQLPTPMADDSMEPDLGLLRLRSASAPVGSLAADVQAAFASEPPALAAATAAAASSAAEPVASASAGATDPEHEGLADMAVSPPQQSGTATPNWGRNGALAAAAAGDTPGEAELQLRRQQRQQQQQQQPSSAASGGGGAHGDGGEQAVEMEEAPPLPQLARSMPVPVSPVAARLDIRARYRHRPPSPPPAGSLAALAAGSAGSGGAGRRSSRESSRQTSVQSRSGCASGDFGSRGGQEWTHQLGGGGGGSSSGSQLRHTASSGSASSAIDATWLQPGAGAGQVDAAAGAAPLPGSFAALAAPQQTPVSFQHGGSYSRTSTAEAQRNEEVRRQQWHAAQEAAAAAEVAAAQRAAEARQDAAALLQPVEQTLLQRMDRPPPPHSSLHVIRQQELQPQQRLPWGGAQAAPQPHRFPWPWGPAQPAGANPYAGNGAAAVAAAVAAVATQGPAAGHATAAGDAPALLQLPHTQDAGGLPDGLMPSMAAMGWEWPVPGVPAGAFAAPAGAAGGGFGGGFGAFGMGGQASAAGNVPGQEQPCRVKLKLWAWREVANGSGRVPGLAGPAAVIPDAVLCSEMGVQFSPCGRFLAACVACQPAHDGGAAANPGGRSGASYEVRIYSLAPGADFGEVLGRRPIKAAHCLTSIQFSPTSQLLLLAYGRRHLALLRSLASDGRSIVPVHTILEVVRVSSAMELVRVLPSADDEVNAAAFHPHPGGGLAYGTKEGRLRLLRTERGGPKPAPKAAPEAADGAESPTAPPPPRGRGNGADSDDSEAEMMGHAAEGAV